MTFKEAVKRLPAMARVGYSAKDFMKPTHKPVAQKQTTLKVGFYGCSDQLVKVGYVAKAGSRPPQSVLVDCPACSRTHKAGRFMFRPARSADEYELTEVKVGEQ